MFVHPTKLVKFPEMCLCHFVPWPYADLHAKFYGDRPRETHLGLNARQVDKYSDFGTVEGYISEMMLDKVSSTIND